MNNFRAKIKVFPQWQISYTVVNCSIYCNLANEKATYVFLTQDTSKPLACIEYTFVSGGGHICK